LNSALLVALGAVGIAAVFGSQAMGYPIEARRLPLLLVWLVAGLAVLVVFEEIFKWRRRRRLANEGAAVEADASGAVHPVVWSALIPYAITIFAYVAIIPRAGYLITTVVFLIGVLLVSRTVRPLTALAVAIGVTGAIWVIFIWLLRLPVPLLPTFG
jgi:hypothetical protein